MDVLQTDFVQGFLRMADDGWSMGWHERNGGNLSYRIREQELEPIRDRLCYDHPFAPIGAKTPTLGGQCFLVTGSGKFFRNVRTAPADSVGIIRLDDAGENYQILWGLENGGRPTSELPSHLMNHAVKARVTGGRHRVIYHCHATNVIALTFLLPLSDRVFTRQLWDMATECPIVFPAGVGVVDWMIPGGREIAVASSKLMETYDVIVWAHHGIFCSGEDFDLTFGLAHTVEKSAEILVKVLAVTPQKRNFIPDDGLRRLAAAFDVPLATHFLDGGDLCHGPETD